MRTLATTRSECDNNNNILLDKETACQAANLLASRAILLQPCGNLCFANRDSHATLHREAKTSLPRHPFCPKPSRPVPCSALSIGNVQKTSVLLGERDHPSDGRSIDELYIVNVLHRPFSSVHGRLCRCGTLAEHPPEAEQCNCHGHQEYQHDACSEKLGVIICRLDPPEEPALQVCPFSQKTQHLDQPSENSYQA